MCTANCAQHAAGSNKHTAALQAVHSTHLAAKNTQPLSKGCAARPYPRDWRPHHNTVLPAMLHISHLPRPASTGLLPQEHCCLQLEGNPTAVLLPQAPAFSQTVLLPQAPAGSGSAPVGVG
jgi:hypothetical protein